MWWLQNFEKNNNISLLDFSLSIEKNDNLDNYIINHPASSPYHTLKWQEFIFKTFGFKTYNLVVSVQDKIYCFLPLTFIKSFIFGNYFVSIGFADTGGILSENNSATKFLLDNISNFCKKFKPQFLEIRNSQDLLCEGLMDKRDKILSYLYLPKTEDELWKSFDPKLRNQIRKALKSNISVSFGGKQIINDFYKVYTRNMRDLGTPQLPFSFFKNLLDIFEEESLVVVLYKDGIPIGGAVGLYYKKTLEVPWASSRRDYFKYCPNNLLYWEILKNSIEKGIEVFSFGRSTINSNTYKFKKQWGTNDLILNYKVLKFNEKDINLSPSNKKYKLFINIWKKLPLFIVKFIGPKISTQLA